MISVQDRVAAINRGKAALRHLEQHPATSRGRLGAARDQLNIVANWRDTGPVWNAVQALESSVLEVYGEAPQEPPMA